jgi:spermidine/putrescine transport system permease protein
LSGSSGRKSEPWSGLLLGYGMLVFGFFYLPLALLILFSFNRSEIGSFPIIGFSLTWYRELFEDLFVKGAFRNSLVVAALATLIATPVGALAAFGLVRARFRFKSLLTSLIIVPMVIPGLLIGIALLIVFVPIFHVGLSLGTAALGHVVILTPYAVLVVATRLYGFDRSLEAAAADLGATPLRVFWHVTLPLIMPGIVAAALIVFTLSLDQFGVTLFTIGAEGTLPMYIWAQLEGGVKPTINALGTLFMVGSLLVLLATQIVLGRKVS